MRGKRESRRKSIPVNRITPAHAGKTQRMQRGSQSMEDHPRACGENKLMLYGGFMMTGSPPRMRGKPPLRCASPRRERITPAHAGKTSTACTSRQKQRDHPRACGENSLGRQGRVGGGGSPPRMRGKPGIDLFGVEDFGITPAHAGKTDAGARRDGFREDHPRACGENPLAVTTLSLRPGSPPRMRGKPASR